MLEGIEGKSRKVSAKTADGAAPPTGGAVGMTAPAVAVARDAYGEPMQSDTREQQIAIAAYYKAQRRGFQGGSPLEDWLTAEREFDGAYLARTMGQQDDKP